MQKCQKCYRPLLDCQACGGNPHKGGLTCSKCRNTGQVCPTHGGHWR
jgi:hypothetical protein